MMKKVAIIGAGLSGLTAAQLLKDHANIQIIEKSRGPGGRIATRYATPYFFDHGAQFFTLHHPEAKQLMQPLLDQGIIKRWDARFVELQKNHIISRRKWHQDYPHYVGTPHMNAIGKFLAKDMHVTYDTQVQSVIKQHDQWALFDTNKAHIGYYDWLIMAMPIAQIKALLPHTVSFSKPIQPIHMQACFSLMLGFDTPLNLDFDAALIRDMDISWLSLNHTKPDREPTTSLLVHSTNRWAEAHIDEDPNQLIPYLVSQTSQVIGQDAKQAKHQALHAWRYANATQQKGPTHFVDPEQHLAICGDWCIRGRVEAALTSGLDLAKTLSSIMVET